ncbi:MAG: hypothetical protein CVT74_11910 [Alphaproteobacteria bacterium HGW-Alphaproteobacteria-13]|jgi:hypothetical protein|nr:MAG: hypothetical protein CVT74_11910 [Alphaproteobacteria bacterium HGW-Alphaproteobacteria-13]
MVEFVAYPSRWRIMLLIMLAVAFVVMGAEMIGAFGAPFSSQRYSPVFILIVGWIDVIFFSLAGVLWIRMLFDRKEQLRIGAEGIRWARWSDWTISWNEITDVTTWELYRQKSIVLHLRDPARFPGRGLLGMAAKANRRLIGGDIAISLTGTDRSVAEALSAIERLRTAARQSTSPRPPA